VVANRARGRGAADGRAGCHIPPGQPHPEGKIETTFQIEELDEMREIKLTCQDYGTYARWLLTETQDATFADIELGFESDRTSLGVLRAPLAKRFLRRWLEMSLVGLHRATGGES
jgi:transposase InsO family protein